MKSMNLFGNNTPKEITKPKETTNQLPPAPIQDEEGNLTFELEGKTYSINVNLEEERERVKTEVNANPLVQYDWFEEFEGDVEDGHWVFYDTSMYIPKKIIEISIYIITQDVIKHLQFQLMQLLVEIYLVIVIN